MALEPHSTFGFSLLLPGSDCPLCSVLFLVDSLTSLSCIYAAFCPCGRRHLLAPPGKDEKNFFYQKNDDCHNHRFCVWNSGCVHAGEFKCRNVPCVSRTGFFHFGVCRSSDSSIQAARLIAACDLAPYCQRIASAFSPGHDSPSNDRFSPHAGISRMENNTLESQLLSEPCRVLAISNVQTAVPATDSFHVRDLHPIPLFSEQACVSD